MNREKKQLLNSTSALLYQFLLIIYSFIMPRLYLVYFGSEINGLISSITQFLGVISLMDMGVGAVVQYNFYEPLANQDFEQLSNIYVSASRFFKKIVAIYMVYLIIFSIIYPYCIEQVDIYTILLIFILAINLVADYLFGVINQYLLFADQKNYIPQLLSSSLLIINGVVGVLLILNGCGIHLVKLVYALILLIKPMVLSVYVKKNYIINKKGKLKNEPIKQKWNGMIQHFTFFVTTSTDTIVLTIFTSLNNVSIYSVYNLIAGGMKQIISAMMSGFDAMFGNMLANGEKDALKQKFLEFEWMMHFVITFIFSCTSALITNFVLLYTANVKDANYNQPIFGLLLSLAICFWCFRTVYYTLIKASGQYKETQISSIVEMVLNLSISIIGVQVYGLVGVALGTLISMIYRTIYLAWYVQKIISYKVIVFFKYICTDAVVFLCAILFAKNNFHTIDSIGDWIICAIATSTVTLGISIGINYLLFRDYIQKIYNKIGNTLLRG